MNYIDRANRAIENIEGSIITLITGIIPWLAPTLPAWLTYYHLTSILQIPLGISVAMALTVEFLGLSGISTAFSYMRHNKVNRAKRDKISLAYPIGAYLFYLLIIVAVNIVQEIPMNAEKAQVSRVISIALLTLISAPAFIIAVARNQQRKIEAEIAGKKAESLGKVPAKNGNGRVTDWRHLQVVKRGEVAGLNTREIVERFGVSERTARNWRKSALRMAEDGLRIENVVIKQDYD